MSAFLTWLLAVNVGLQAGLLMHSPQPIVLGSLAFGLCMFVAQVVQEATS